MNICPNCGLDNRDTARFCNNCGGALGAAPAGGTPIPATPPPVAAPPPAPARGQTLPLSSVLHGQYLILKKLAEGGMGAVYLAQDQQLFDRLCVVKEMLPYYSTPAEKADAELKFEREARLLANLRHPGIPQVYDYFIELDRYYLVMEFVDGEDLAEKLAQARGPLPEKEVIDYVGQVASVLAYIGRQNPPVIHRDIKPANIILDKNTGQVKLVDFGIAREAQSGGPAKSQALGTPGYSPPEQYSQNVEPRSDVFALGATMHCLLSGLDPSQFPLFAYPPLSQVVPGISSELEDLVKRMVEQDVARRPTAQEVRNELKKVGQPQVVGPTGPFAFRNGALVHDVMELALECDRCWDDGVYHLYNGHFEPWLQGLNRYDLAGRAETIRKKGGDPNAGLEEFLRALNPTMALPVLSVTPLQLNLGAVEKGDKPLVRLEVTNAGRGYLHGDARVLLPWVRVTPATFGCQPGERVSLSVEIDSSQLDEGNVSERLLSFTSSGGQATVTAQFLVTWQPKLALEPDCLDFGEIMEEQLGQQLPVQFTLTNAGGGLLEGRLNCPDSWVILGARDFRLLSGQSLVVGVVADSGQLALARSQLSTVRVTSSGGDLALPVRVGVMKEIYKQRAARWGVYGGLLLLGMLGWSIAATLSMQALFGFRRESLVDAAWLAGALVVGWLATRLARSQIPLLDEIEAFYHQGDLASELPTYEFDLKRLGLAAGGAALAGLALGFNYHRLYQAVWAIPAGALAGALLGALLALSKGLPGSAGPSRRFGGARLLAAGMAMAFLGTLLAASYAGVGLRPSPSALRLIVWWTVVGLVLTAEAYRPLPLRLRWLLGKVRAGLLCVLLAYFGWLAGMALVSPSALPVVGVYTRLPGLDLGRFLGQLLVMALVVGGMALGLWADATAVVAGPPSPVVAGLPTPVVAGLPTAAVAGLPTAAVAGLPTAPRRQTAQVMLRALAPGLGIALVGFVLGRIVFTVLGGFMVRGWGVLATVLAVEAAAGWLIQARSPQLAQVWGTARGAAGQVARPLAAKVTLPPWLTNAWGKVRGRLRLPAAPAGGWFAGLTLAAAVGVAGTLVLLAPLAANVLGTILLALGCLAAWIVPVIVLLALVVWWVRTR